MKVLLSIVITGLVTLPSLSSANADITEEREARSSHIQSLYEEVRDGRLDRSERIQALLDIARLEAEERKERRNGNGSDDDYEDDDE